MTYSDILSIFGLFILFIGLGLLVYLQLFGLLLRFHFKFFPMIAKRYDRLLGIEFREPVDRHWSNIKEEFEPESFEPLCQATNK
jgi:hypothetical protein